MGKKKGAGFWMCLGLIICLVSMIGASLVQSNFGGVTIKEMSWEDSSGHGVSALLYKPSNAAKTSPAPAIITVEGWYNNKEMQDLTSVEYARRGYVVIAVDMYGHGDSENLPSNELYDGAVGVYAAVELAASLPYVDKSRIGLTGHSSGGAASLMAVAIDNQQVSPRIAAVLQQACGWVDDLGEDHSADFGSRSVGIIADKYDEFFFATYNEDGSIATGPRDFIGTDGAKNFLNFNEGALAGEAVPGELYQKGIDGKTAYRVIYTPTMIHPWVHFSKIAVSHGIEFFDTVFGAPAAIAAANQVWQVKAFFNAIGIVGFIMFLFNFAIVLLGTAFFAELRTKKEVGPVETSGSSGTIWFFAILCLGALFSGLSYMWAINSFYGVYTAFWPQGGPLTIGMWCAVCGVFALGLMLVYYFFHGKKNGFSPSERGIVVSAKIIGKTVLLALAATAAAFLLVFFADYFFKTDFRLWVLTLKAFNADKLLIGLRFLPLFLVFYVLNSVSTNCFNYNTIGGKTGNLLILGAFNALGAIVFDIIQYGTFFTTGVLQWHGHEGHLISGIWLFPAMVFLFFTPFLTRYIYRRTNNPYLGGIVNALVITVMSCANTTTIIGGAVNSAANTVAQLGSSLIALF